MTAREGIPSEQAKAAYDALYAEDESDTKKNMKLKIEAILTPVEGRPALLAEYFNKDTKFSYVELENTIAGFTTHFKSEEVRKPYFDPFFEQILDALRIRSRQVASVRKLFKFCFNSSRLSGTTYSQTLMTLCTFSRS